MLRIIAELLCDAFKKLKACAEIIVHDVHVHICWINGDGHKSVSLRDEDEQDGQFSKSLLTYLQTGQISTGEKKTLLLIIQQDFKSHVPSIMPPRRPLWCVSVHRKHSR